MLVFYGEYCYYSTYFNGVYMASIVNGISAVGVSIISLIGVPAVGSKIEKNTKAATIKKIVGKAMQIFPSFMLLSFVPSYGPILSTCFLIPLVPSIIKYITKSDCKALDIADKVLMIAAKVSVYLFSLGVLKVIGQGILDTLLDGELGFTAIAIFLFNCFAVPLGVDLVNTYKNYFQKSQSQVKETSSLEESLKTA